jgi:hypothetical protein
LLLLDNQRLQSSSLLNGSIFAATTVATGTHARFGFTLVMALPASIFGAWMVLPLVK